MSCAKCGSNEHATGDCHHDLLSYKCEICGSIEHSTGECPHVFLSKECSICGSKNHSTDKCPHDYLSKECSRCGSKDHSTDKCPHDYLSKECSKCGSKDHSTDKCPQGIFATKETKKEIKNEPTSKTPTTSSSSSTDENGCLKIVVYIALIIGAIAVAIWLAVNIILPVTLLNSALIFTILALVFKKQKVLFAILALLGGGYLMLDIMNGWFSLSFIQNVVKDSIWISVFVYINAIALGIATFLLVWPLWGKSKLLEGSQKGKSALLKVLMFLIIAVGISSMPLIYQFIEKPFNSIKQSTEIQASPEPVETVNNTSINTSQSYTVISDRAYFYEQPNADLRKSAYLINGEKFESTTTENGFAYVEFTNAEGVTTIGWISLTDATSNLESNNSPIETQKNELTDIDGNVYHTVTIGSQTWMVENLRTTKYNDGTSIPYVTDATAWAALSTPGYCYYNNDAANTNIYGALYNWYTVNTGKLAPTGWHMPTDAEWTILENYLIANGYNYDGTTTGNKIAKSLAATTNWNSYSSTGAIGNDLTKNNTSGFAGLPGGSRSSDGAFYSIGDCGYWWSSTQYFADNAWSRSLYYNDGTVSRNGSYEQNGFSVRCLRDY